MSQIIDSKPSSFDEPYKLQVRKDDIMEEYQSIMNNDVWEIVPKPKWKLVVTSKWIYKIKHVSHGNIKKYKAIFLAR